MLNFSPLVIGIGSVTLVIKRGDTRNAINFSPLVIGIGSVTDPGVQGKSLISLVFLDTKWDLTSLNFRKTLFCSKTPSFCEKTNNIYLSSDTAKTLFLFYP